MRAHDKIYRSIHEREIADPVQGEAVQLVRRIAKATGLSATEIAKRSGLSPSTLTRIYPAPSITYTLSSRSIDKIKRAFPDVLNPTVSKSSGGEDRSTPAANKIPIYSFGDAWDGEIKPDLERGNIVEDIFHFEARMGFHHESNHYVSLVLENCSTDRCIGMCVVGDRMQPRLYPGEIAIVSIVKPAPVNCEALFTLSFGAGKVMFFAHIVERKADHILVNAYSDQAKVVSISKNLIEDMFPVVSVLTNSH